MLHSEKKTMWHWHIDISTLTHLHWHIDIDTSTLTLTHWHWHINIDTLTLTHWQWYLNITINRQPNLTSVFVGLYGGAVLLFHERRGPEHPQAPFPKLEGQKVVETESTQVQQSQQRLVAEVPNWELKVNIYRYDRICF